MTFLAFDLGVFAEQRKARQTVIKACGFPVTFVVAGGALLAELAFVLVVFLMAADAIGFNFFFIKKSGVTGCTLGLRMLAQ